MYNITLISTRHNENGKCNSNELHKIIETICPDAIFLEAFESSYTEYNRLCFSQFGVYSERLEINAIQKYSRNHIFKYIPVLDTELSDDFNKRLNLVSKNPDCQKLYDNYNSLEIEYGFQFLNSEKSIQLQQKMRELEKHILNNNEICQKSNDNIDAYENSMIRNIYTYSKENSYNTAIFMCGAAHRKTIIQKIQEYEKKSTIKLNWNFYIP